MDETRLGILKNVEDRWKVILIKCENSLETKKFFREQFNLELKELKNWMTEGKVLLMDCRFNEANKLRLQLDELKAEVKFIQTGISYRGRFNEKEIVNTLIFQDYNLTDYVINPAGYFHLKDMFNLIEDNELATACLKYLLDFGAPIENR